MAEVNVLLRLRIRCAICDRFVEEWSFEEDIGLMRYLIQVRCHGDRDNMEIPWYLFSRYELRGVLSGEQEGVAFVTRHLREPVDGPQRIARAIVGPQQS